MINKLIKEYDQWLKTKGLPKMSADELLAEDNVTAENKAWLRDFLERWETAEEEDKYGGYLITDPCYIVPKEEWHDFCEKSYGNSNWFDPSSLLPYKIEGLGEIIECDGTTYGDGAYKVSKGKEVLVDSGTVCLVRLDKGAKPTNYQGTAVTKFRETADRWYALAQTI